MGNKFVSFVKNKPAFAIAAAAVILLAAAGVAALLGAFGGKDAEETLSTVNPPAVQESMLNLSDTAVRITALDSDSLGVNPGSAFKLVFDGSAEESAVASALRVEPEQPFRLEKVSGSEYSVQFENPLEKDSIYRFILSDKNTGEEQSWAFQTKKSLNVVRTLPRSKGVQVPVNSGIEVTFNAENIENPEKYFEISPATPGRFEQHGKTLVFVPEKLEEATIYQVTVKKGIGVKGSTEVLENDYTFHFQTAVPESNLNNRSYFVFPDSMYNFTPQAVPAMEVYAGENLIDTEVSVEVYRYTDAESFLKDLKAMDKTPYWAVAQNKGKAYDESKLGKAASITARIISYQRQYWSSTYLLLPSSLPEGYYLVKAVVDGAPYYTQLQINPSSVYLLATKEKTLAWLNDSVTGLPLAGAEISLDNGTQAKSNEEGLAILDEKLPEADDYQNYHYIIRPAKGLPFVAQVKSGMYQPYYGYYYNSDITNSYWTYLYLDKGIYLPEDTINIWGVIKPRDGGDIGKEAVLELIRYDYSTSGDENVSVLTSAKTPISSNGTFTGSLAISGYNPGSYEVRVKVGEKIFMSNYLQIMEYVKPAYKLDITPDRNYLYAWETIQFDINAAFFEGTPAKGLKLAYNCNVGGNTLSGIDAPDGGGLVTDASGNSKIRFAPMTSEEGWRPLNLFLYVNNKEAEEQSVNQYSNIPVFPKDTMIELQSSIEGANGKISIATSRIDLDKLKGKTGTYFTEDEYRGASVNMPLKARLYERHYEREKTGEYYDYINKVKRYTYNYNEVQSLVKEYGFTTANGKYEINFTAEKDKNYYLEITGADSKGRLIKEIQYIYNWNFISPYSGNSFYSIVGGKSNYLYDQGETVTVEVQHNAEEDGGNAETTDTGGTTDGIGGAAADSGGKTARYLFVRMKNGILDTRISTDSRYDFPFDKEFIPNMYVKALCFDGVNVYDAGLQQYSYATDGSKLEISMKADKEQYRPGETVKLALDVRDAGGKPCRSEVNISVVDEAYFAIYPQYVDTLSSLYARTISSGIVLNYLSYHSIDEVGTPMAEGGEGGDMYVRRDFKDSALFLTVASDSSGKAETSFKLPDNLTSWRVTYQAVTEDLKAGSGKMNIASKLPFFIDTIFNQVFVTGDSPSVLIRANGTELPDTATVSYTVVLTEAGGKSKTYQSGGSANKFAEVPLGALDAGSYKIRVEAVSGDLTDAMERSFRVSDSLLETAKTDYVNLSDGAVLANDARGLTSLVFYGEDSSLLHSELQKLYWSWGQRLDQKLAVKIAGDLLEKNFKEEIYRDESFDIMNYQTEDGGLALFTYDSSNPALSAKMCSLASEYVDRAALTSYFRKLLEDGKTMPEDVAYAYWGLAALREPVLLEIRNRLEAGGLTPEIKLILGAALSEIGDYQGARKIYDEALKTMGKVESTYAYLENGSRDESIDATALCSLIGLRINAPEKLKLFNYIKSNSTSELLVNMERLIFVKNHIKTASLDCSFSYELDGSKKQIDLKNGGYYRLTVTAEQLPSLKFSNVKGKIVAASTYVAPVNEIRSAEGSPVSLKRTYTAEGVKGSPSDFDRSYTIRIRITPQFSEGAPDGYYEITDVLPAGFRYVSGYPGKERTDWYPDEVTGQKVVFGYFYRKAGFKNQSIEYFAKAVSPGTYTADNAAIRHGESGVAGFTEKMEVRVK